MNTSADHNLHLARTLILRYGWNTMCYQILNPGIALWFSKAHEAVIGYAETGTHIIAAGSPVTAEEHLDDVVMEFSEYASSVKKKICFFGAQERIAAILSQRSPTSSVLLGAQPAWSPEGWLGTVRTKQSLRAQMHRALNKSVTAALWNPNSAIPKSALYHCLHEWIASRHLPPMHFLVEPNTLEHLEDRIVIAAYSGGEIIGFCVASPIPLRKGWLVEQIVRGIRAPNGTSELMLDALMNHLHSIGSRFVTLGLSPLSRHYTSPSGIKPEATGSMLDHFYSGIKPEAAASERNHSPSDIKPEAALHYGSPLWLRAALQFTRLYGKYFYNFDGLDSFKAKFLPTEWEPVYAITNERTPTPSTLYAIASAFSGMSPVKFVLKGMMKMAAGKLQDVRHLV